MDEAEQIPEESIEPGVIGAILDARNLFGVQRPAEVATDVPAERALSPDNQLLVDLNELLQWTASEVDHDRIVQRATDTATKLLGASFGAFFSAVPDQPDTCRLGSLSVSKRESSAQIPHTTVAIAASLTAEGIRRAGSKNTPEAPHDPWFTGLPEPKLPFASHLVVPVVSSAGEVIGGFFFDHTQANAFTARSRQLATLLATQCAVAIETATAVRRARELELESQDSDRNRVQLQNKEQLVRSEFRNLRRLQDEFLATLSHELRTPLHTIQGWTTLILAEPSIAPADLKLGLETIHRSVRAQIRIIEDLLDESLILTGKLQLEERLLYAQDMLRACIESISTAAEAKQIHIDLSLDPGVGLIVGDPNRLRQAISNVLSNAVKFTPARGRIAITLRTVGDYAQIVVRDNGIGIDPDFLPHAFDRFRQAETGTTRRYGGMGLGLSIARSLIEMHAGTISARSFGTDKGTEISINLPLSRRQHVSDQSS